MKPNHSGSIKMRFVLCNEVLRHLPFNEQAQLSAALGYDGLEVAPFTLHPDAPHCLSKAMRNEFRRMAEDVGQPIAGLHWLLVAPSGLSITEASLHDKTCDVMRALIDLAVDLGATYLVHGSPAQRKVTFPGDAERAEAAFSKAALHAQSAGLIYLLEPLDPGQTNWASSLAEALDIVARIGNPALCSMLDVSAAGNGEAEAPDTLLRRHMASGRITHVHLNDRNRRALGQGQDQFAPILRALTETGYQGICGVEPFEYHPDPAACAARAIGYLRGIEEGLST